MASVQDLFDTIERRECVLFLGAKIHYPPPGNSAYKYFEQQRPPLGSGAVRLSASGSSRTTGAELVVERIEVQEKNGPDSEESQRYLPSGFGFNQTDERVAPSSSRFVEKVPAPSDLGTPRC